MNQTTTSDSQKMDAVQAEADAALDNPVAEQAQALEEIPDLGDDDVESAPKVVPLLLTLASGEQRKVFVKRLSGEDAIKLLRDASTAGKDQNAVPIVKLTRCLVQPKDHSKARYTQQGALDVITRGDANLLSELLRCIHTINPLIKNA